MHTSTFEYLKPTNGQLEIMATIRTASAKYSEVLETHLPNGPDKTYALRKLREVAMWANVAITRQPDGAPRIDYPLDHPAPGDLGSVPL